MTAAAGSDVRRAAVPALAKINLSLKVLHKRPDGYHEIRTVFQTISLADRLEIEFRPGRKTDVEIESGLDIPPEENLVVKAALRLMERGRIRGHVRFRLTKRIPAGGGLGGGSSDAAAVLLALPVLAGRGLPFSLLAGIGAELGSDVPFFLYGGAALGAGRGTELYPLPDLPRRSGLLVCPAVAVSTADAYRALGRDLTPDPASSRMSGFQGLCWMMGRGLSAEGWAAAGENDFEPVVYRAHPQLAALRRRLERSGARPAMLSGSGSSLFGIFPGREEAERARSAFPGQRTESFYLVSRARYRKMWLRSLLGRLRTEEWPPRSR